jgi:class 3 adenylate cyclase/tetratricopeptide (TPR) repeat protein
MVDGTWVLVDLSGFTRLTERLTRQGVEGVELLHEALSRSFRALLGRSLNLDGDVLGFAGDAALVHFDGSDHVARAAEAASSMAGELATVPPAVTGGRRLRVSIGVHTGPVLVLLAGTAQQCLFMCGPDVELLARLQSTASPGQALMSDSVASALDPNWRGSPVPPGVELRRPRATRTRWAGEPATSMVDVPLVAGARAPTWSFRLLSQRVRDLITADDARGDHRVVSVGFLGVAGMNGVLAEQGPGVVHAVLTKVVDITTRVTEELSIDLLDTDVGVDSMKIMVAAGAPRAIPDDEGRLLLALRRIVDECALILPDGVSVSAGAQRGRVFAGRLGVPGRSTYTVIGDPVNVAARALGVAAAGEVVGGAGLGVASLESVRAVSLGVMSLRNRVEPIELWRVDVVAAPEPAGQRLPPASIGIARRNEWAAVRAAWKQAENGIGGVVCVHGEPGMGVSDLVHEAALTAGTAATLLVPDPFARHVPYGLVAALVRSLARSSGDAMVEDGLDDGFDWLRRQQTQVPGYLRAWVDDAIAIARGAEAKSDADPRSRAARAARVLAALVVAAAPRPWMLAVDDLDSADESSQAVLAELHRFTMSESVLLVTGSRSRPSVTDGWAQPSIVELLAVDDMVAEALLLEVAPSLRSDEVMRILAAGKGNPFVLTELAGHRASGELPDSLQRLGTVLIDALPVSVRRLVRDASTFGTTVSLAMVASVLDQPELVHTDRWAQASSVLRPAADGTLVFVHDVYRSVAHEALTFGRRRQLHAAIADHLLAGNLGGDVALHLQLAGRLSEALPLATAAGLAAKDAGALAEAGELLGRAIEMARATNDSSIVPLLLERGQVLSWLGDRGGAEQMFRRAARLRPSPVERARLSHLAAFNAAHLGELRRAKRWVASGLAAAEASGAEGRRWRAELLLDEAMRHSDLGRQQLALRASFDALALAEELDDVTLRGMAHQSVEISYSILMDEAAITHGDAAMACFEQAGNDRYLASLYNNVGLTSMHLGRWSEAFLRYERSREHSLRTGRPFDIASVESNIGFLLYRQGNHGEADTHASRALRIFEMVGARRYVGYARLLRGLVAGAEGRFSDADDWVTAARAEFAAVEDAALVVDCDTVRLAHLLAAGRVDEVLAAAPMVKRHLGAAEVQVVIDFDRTVGHARALSGDRSGVDQIRSGLVRARANRLVYDEYLCLDTLVALADELPARELARARRDRDRIALQLGIVR